MFKEVLKKKKKKKNPKQMHVTVVKNHLIFIHIFIYVHINLYTCNVTFDVVKNPSTEIAAGQTCQFPKVQL